MYVLLTQPVTEYYATDPSSRQGRCPTSNKTATVLTTAKIWLWVLQGLNVKTDGLTYWLN